MALSDVKCRNTRPASKLQKLSDGGGLQLWVQPSGTRLWRLAYRFDGKQKLLSLGSYPVISLADARQVREIDTATILTALRCVEVRGRYESASRLRSIIGTVFRFAIATARAEADPTIALRGALINPTVTPRAAITDPKALGGLLRAVDAFDGQPTTRAALKLMAMLFPRPGELRAAEWEEFDFESSVWIIPEARMKMRRPHRVPLSKQAISVLTSLKEISGGGSLLFPGVRSVSRPISDNTLNAALRRMGYSKEEATAHGFRATASTLLNECGKWHPDAIERQLAHIENNDVRRAYARAEHWDERVKMMQWWADYLDELKSKNARVISMRGHSEPAPHEIAITHFESNLGDQPRIETNLQSPKMALRPKGA
ncbi:site-specific integrase [Mesorhizobium sp. CA10]|uniref:tyrosine-type recombinase/integrase n=1 Tax=Mesorhizobium sp. CA10 TaxID=588495 RepID=UPI001CCB478E|nr:site-specific integrase [Mesorhizobium sp. CA10]MBZ9883591.1 site-specific integrase [Mesorhizobium sp. CA10]